MPLSTDEVNTLVILARTAASFSLVSVLAMFAVYLWNPKARVAANRLGMYLGLATCFADIGGIISVSSFSSSAFCQFQAVSIQFGLRLSSLFCLCICLEIWLVVVLKLVSTPAKMLPYENIMVGITTVFSLVEALAYLGARDENDKPFYGVAGTWCWLGNDRNRLVVYYVLGWIILILSWITFALAQVALQKKADSLANASERGVSPAIARTLAQLNLGTAEAMRGHVRKLCLYLVAYIVPVLVSSINRVQNMASPGNTIFGLYVLTSFFGQLHGIAIACVFFTSEYHKAMGKGTSNGGTSSNGSRSRGSVPNNTRAGQSIRPNPSRSPSVMGKQDRKASSVGRKESAAVVEKSAPGQ